jgi:hypothetical protein
MALGTRSFYVPSYVQPFRPLKTCSDLPLGVFVLFVHRNGNKSSERENLNAESEKPMS